MKKYTPAELLEKMKDSAKLNSEIETIIAPL